jgi:hypothetical protein
LFIFLFSFEVNGQPTNAQGRDAVHAAQAYFVTGPDKLASHEKA